MGVLTGEGGELFIYVLKQQGSKQGRDRIFTFDCRSLHTDLPSCQMKCCMEGAGVGSVMINGGYG
jgi:hypothetical protein